MSNPSEPLMTSSKPLMEYVTRRLFSIANSLDERMDEVALRLALKRLDFLERKLILADMLRDAAHAESKSNAIELTREMNRTIAVYDALQS
jgi:hypothetical protein